MRVLYLLFLLPLGALASCPAGIQLSNVPINTVFPYCLKWESSTLGGCAVGCGSVCVEFPGSGLKGPTETTGAECELGGSDNGGGDDTGGGDDNGGGDTGGGSDWLSEQFAKQPNYVALTNIGDGYVADLSPGFNSLLEEAWWIKRGIGDIRTNTFNLNNHAVAIQEKMDNMVSSLDFLTGYSTESSNKLDNNFNALIDAVNSSGSAAYEIKSVLETGMSLWGMDSSTLHSINNHAAIMSGDLSAIKYMNEGIGSAQINLQTQMAGDLAAIKDMMGNGQGSGGEGSEGIDYSKMPGAADNPLHVAGSNYESNLCQEGDNCAFDLGKINKQYDDKKAELKDKYNAIKDEVTEIFKFQFSGSASALKCFDLYVVFGKSYQVCPESDDYWQLLAALMMFIFYFVALMTVARR